MVFFLASNFNYNHSKLSLFCCRSNLQRRLRSEQKLSEYDISRSMDQRSPHQFGPSLISFLTKNKWPYLEANSPFDASASIFRTGTQPVPAILGLKVPIVPVIPIRGGLFLDATMPPVDKPIESDGVVVMRHLLWRYFDRVEGGGFDIFGDEALCLFDTPTTNTPAKVKDDNNDDSNNAFTYSINKFISSEAAVRKNLAPALQNVGVLFKI